MGTLRDDAASLSQRRARLQRQVVGLENRLKFAPAGIGRMRLQQTLAEMRLLLETVERSLASIEAFVDGRQARR
jgi:hypothetical protein